MICSVVEVEQRIFIEQNFKSKEDDSHDEAEDSMEEHDSDLIHAF